MHACMHACTGMGLDSVQKKPKEIILALEGMPKRAPRGSKEVCGRPKKDGKTISDRWPQKWGGPSNHRARFSRLGSVFQNVCSRRLYEGGYIRAGCCANLFVRSMIYVSQNGSSTKVATSYTIINGKLQATHNKMPLQNVLYYFHNSIPQIMNTI